jgi:hypothetical protein
MSTTTNDAVNDFLMGGAGAPSAKFDTVGRTYKGTIVKSEVRQQIDMDTDEPEFWKDGKPKMQAVITIQTDEIDPTIEDDDGQRRLFVKGNMQKAIREAVKAAGCSRLDVGGVLAVRYSDNGEATKRGFSPPKLYVAQYRPPAIGVDDLIDNNGNGQAPAPQPMAQPAAPAPIPQPAPQPVAAGDLF